jgi:predicted DNA-binding transcriptional regulator AlpA
MERQVIHDVKPIAIPLMQAHQLVGCSRTQFKKIFVDEHLIKPVDMGARGLSVIVTEVEEAVRKRTAMIRSGEIVPPIRSSRGKRAAAA